MYRVIYKSSNTVFAKFDTLAEATACKWNSATPTALKVVYVVEIGNLPTEEQLQCVI